MERSEEYQKQEKYEPVINFPKYWCGNCLRIYFARHYNIHLNWKDCPYTCKYKEEMRELEKSERNEE